MTGQADIGDPSPRENVLVLVRHGESEWNRLNRFTGWKDVGLTDEGVAEAHRAGAMLKAEDRHFARVFQGKDKPKLTFDDGVEVVKMLMTAYQNTEQGKAIAFPPKGLDKFVPQVAKGEWKP